MPRNGTDGMPFPKRDLTKDPLPPGCTTVCPTCENPVDNQGYTTQRRRKTGRQCPQCGFRLAKNMTEAQLANMIPFKKDDPRTKAIASLGGKNMQLSKKEREEFLSDAMRKRAEERIDKIIDPYFSGLELQPKDEWSPSTKLDFYIKQSVLADKIHNRLEGLPVARNRQVDKDNEDVAKLGRVTPAVARSLVLDLLEGAGAIESDEVDTVEVEDGVFEPSANGH